MAVAVSVGVAVATRVAVAVGVAEGVGVLVAVGVGATMTVVRTALLSVVSVSLLAAITTWLSQLPTVAAMAVTIIVVVACGAIVSRLQSRSAAMIAQRTSLTWALDRPAGNVSVKTTASAGVVVLSLTTVRV